MATSFPPLTSRDDTLAKAYQRQADKPAPPGNRPTPSQIEGQVTGSTSNVTPPPKVKTSGTTSDVDKITKADIKVAGQAMGTTGTAGATYSLNPGTINSAAFGGQVQSKSFPSTLPPYALQINFCEYNPNIAIRGADFTEKTDLTIALPIPANLLSTTGLDYSNLNLGALGGEALGALLGFSMADNKKAYMNDAIKNFIASAKSGDSGTQDILSVLARRAVSGVSETFGGAYDLIKGNTPNPHVAVTFNAVKLRTFSFAWRLSPSSEQESKNLHSIIKLMHKRALPADTSAYLLSYPSQCLIQILPDQLNDLFKFKPSVITDISVNYAPSGIPSFFRDKMPTEVELSISFQEIQIRTAKDYN